MGGGRSLIYLQTAIESAAFADLHISMDWSADVLVGVTTKHIMPMLYEQLLVLGKMKFFMDIEQVLLKPGSSE